MAEEEDYIDVIRRGLNNAHQQNDVAEIEGFSKSLRKLYKKGKKIYKKGKKIYKKGKKIYKKGKNIYKKGKRIYKKGIKIWKYFQNPSIAEMESLYEFYNRVLPKVVAEKQDLLNNVREIIDLYNSNHAQKEDEDAQEQVTASSEDGDEMAEEVISVSALPKGIYYASKFHNSK